jgi:hydroxypyruvate reductase
MNVDFDPSVLAPDPARRERMVELLMVGLEAVDPESLTARALAGRYEGPTVVMAMGKAAPAMARGAARAVDVVSGICISDHLETVPEPFALVLGNHPIPGPDSLAAGELLLATARGVADSTAVVALVSGGGSTLCEVPRPGITLEFLAEANRRLIEAGIGIEEVNLARAHLSAVKCGGVSRAARRPIDTFVLSDVAGADPGVVASGPTVPRDPDPEAALAVLAKAGIEVTADVTKAIDAELPMIGKPAVTLVADGFDAADAMAAASPQPVTVAPNWLGGPVEAAVQRFLAEAGPGVTIGVGETVVEHKGRGRGGRNTHAALIAARRLAGTDRVFVAFATDGVDGSSQSAGAIVDGSTLVRGGDPGQALADFDSARYLAASSDLLRCGPTGTNVSDIWIHWRRSEELAVE